MSVLGLWPMAMKQPLRVSSSVWAGLHVLQPHAGHTGLIAQHFVERAVQLELNLAGSHFFHQLVHHDGFGLERVAAMYQVHLAGDVGEVQRLFHGGVATADHAADLVAVEETIAGGAARNALAHERFLGRQTQVFGRGARGDDERVAAVLAAVTGEHERALGEVDRVDVVEDDLGVEAFGVGLEALHQIGPLHALRIGWPVVHIGGGHQLPALGNAGDQHRVEVGARRVDRGRITGGARAENQNF